MNNIVCSVMKSVHNVLSLRGTAMLAVFLCCTQWSMAQIQVEYFWNVDNGLGECTRVEGSAAVGGELNFRLSTEELPYGINRLGIRAFVVSDTASYYSPTIYSYVAKPRKNAVSAIEYFWDNDPGVGMATKVANANANVGESVSFRIATDTLSIGIHKLGMRVKDVHWSHTVYKYVVSETKPEHYARYVEYFWDNDPGFGNGVHEELQPNAAGNTVSFEVSTEGLSDGIHSLYVRTRAVGWSPLTCYLVRVESGKAQIVDDIEYFWDVDPGYGNGIKVPFEQGSTVDIKDFEPDIEGMTGDHVFCLRAHGGGGWSTIHAGSISFSVEGNYTLNDLPNGTERNFMSMSEMFSFFVERTVTADVTVTVRDGATFLYEARTDDAFALLAGVAEDLKECGGRLTFKADNSAVINIDVDEQYFKETIALASMIITENVTLNINGDAYDFSELAYSSDEVCAGGSSEEREWSSISSGVTVEWSAAPRSGCKVTGYKASGNGNLPAMVLGNSGTSADYIDYNVSVKKNETEILTFTYRITVGNTIAGKNIVFTSSNPADNAVANPGTVKINWSNVSGAHSYIIVVEKNNELDGTTVCDTIAQTSRTYDLNVENGHNYRYSVMACAKCDSTAFTTRSLYAFRTDADDIAALKVLHSALGGDSWSKKWVFDAEVPISDNFPGVTFNYEGRVTAINLNGYGLVGELPAEGFVLPRLASLVLSNNNITGDVAEFVDGCEALTTLKISHARLSALSKALPNRITALDMTAQYYNQRASLSELTVSSIVMDKDNMDGIIQTDIISYNHSAGDFSSRSDFNIYDNSLADSHGQLTYSGGFYKLSLRGEYTLGQDADVILVSSSKASKNSLLPARLSFVMGDANIDAMTDVLDVQHTFNYVAGTNGASGFFNCSAANTFDDALLNVQDVVATVNLVLDENSTASLSRRKVSARMLDNNSADAYLSVTDGVLKIAANSEVAALDITLEGVKAADMKQLVSKKRYNAVMRDTETGVRIIMFSLSGDVLPVGITGLFAVDGDAVITGIKAADSKAQAMSTAIEDANTTRIESISGANSGENVIYDLSGRRIDVITSSGVYIINGEKVIVK